MPTRLITTALINDAEADLSQSIWPQLEATYYHVTDRVLQAFRDHRIGEEHFYSVSGYGHDDLGRQKTDTVFADALQAEAALVRSQIVSGTHAIAIALRGVLAPGNSMVCLTGPPYDTLEEVIGIRGNAPLSLKHQGINYVEYDCFTQPDWATNTTIQQALTQATVVYLQRSRGYSLRQSLTIPDIKAICQQVRTVNPHAIIVVDNCYGEWTEPEEPTAVGADLIAGSLIKNPGGGIVPTGGYVAGKASLVNQCATALTAPGIGPKGGYTFDLTRTILQGLFLAPNAVKEALKSMTLATHVFEALGYTCFPRWRDWPRSDIIQTIELGSAQKLVTFCQILQQFSPVNSGVMPIPAIVPGYADEVVMAGGTFIDGATLELSADGPLRPPYAVFLQGGLHYGHARVVLQAMVNALTEK